MKSKLLTLFFFIVSIGTMTAQNGAAGHPAEVWVNNNHMIVRLDGHQPAALPLKLSLINLTGQVVYSAALEKGDKDGELTTHLPYLPKGIYLVQITDQANPIATVRIKI